MSNYIKDNKAAWEEAFDHKKEGWGDNNDRRLCTEELPFFAPDVVKELKQIDFRGKSVAQFCCNNGRELLSLMQLGAESGTGFDIAENIIEQAKTTAKKANITNCNFVACNILDIPEQYKESFDFILFTIGAITWFQDLMPLFQKVSDCLKPGGVVMIHDYHPVLNMLPIPGEDAFDEKHLNQFAYSYFRKEPWIENQGMSYISGEYDSKQFTSFNHNMSEIINALCQNHMKIKKMAEYDYDIGISEVYDHKGIPLSYILIAEKEQILV
jgi:ubiquinone/menaquinone biosynthesis C-methylase UbiE